jgi:ABC-type phosphate/phosphonate transport system permease subunit
VHEQDQTLLQSLPAKFAEGLRKYGLYTGESLLGVVFQPAVWTQTLALFDHQVAANTLLALADTGHPIEAVRATGANWVQVVRYAVIPQIIPPFTAFTIYRWDINVRSSTIIGFVGGGGIGFYLIQWIQINDMRAVSAVFIAIAVVVVSLDYVSAKIRERLA